MVCAITSANSSSNENDNERMLTLSTISASDATSSTVISENASLENALVLNLARANSVDCLLSNVDTETHTYTDETYGSFYAREIGSDMRNVFDIATNAAHDEHFVVSSKFSPPADKSYYDLSYTYLSDNIRRTIQVVDPTLSLYDSHIDFSTNENYGPFYASSINIADGLTTTNFSAMFDSSQPTNNLIRAINSHSSNSQGTNLLSVYEDYTFNNTYALGANSNYFYLADNDTGRLRPQTLQTANTLSSNSFYYTIDPEMYDVASCSGIYKLDTNSPTIGTEVSFSASDAPSHEVRDLTNSHLPLYNSGATDEYRALPGSAISQNSFDSIFISNYALSNYHFDISGAESSNSGYSVDETELVETEPNIFTLDSSDLQDNLLYMRTFVTLDHDLVFNTPTLSLTSSGNANEANLEYFSLNNQRETLSSSNFDNGQILLNNRTPATRTAILSKTTDALSPLVFYGADEDPVSGILEAQMTNYNVQYDTTLLFKNPQYSAANHHSSSNGSYLDLFDGTGLANDRFLLSDIAFTSNLSDADYDANSLHVFRVNPHQILQAINGVVDTATSTEVSNYSVSASITNLPVVLPTNLDTLNRLQAIINLKDVSNLSIYDAAEAAGWSLNNSPSVGHGRVTTTTESAHRSQTSVTSWPSQASVRDVLTGEQTTVHYSIDLSSNTYVDPISETLHQYFYAVIDWGYAASALTNRLIINDDALRRTSNCTNNTPVQSSISNSNGSILVTTTNTVQFNFDLQLLPFDDLQLTTPIFTSTTTYTMKLNQMEPTLGNEYIIDSAYRPFHLLVTPSGSSSKITGMLDSADFSELSVYIQSLNDGIRSPTLLTATYNISAFYHIPITMELHSDKNNTLGDINLSLLPLTYCALTSSKAYSVTLVSEDDPISYTVDYFTSQYNNSTGLFSGLNASLSSTAHLASAVLGPVNGYSTLPWGGTRHDISLSRSGTNTILTVSRGMNNVIFTLTIPGYRYLNTTAFITRCNKDIYKVHKTVAGDGLYAFATVTTTYIGTSYGNQLGGQSGYNGYNSAYIPVDNGIILRSSSTTLNFTTVTSLGHVFNFSLLPDLIYANMVSAAPASATLTSIRMNQTYQFVANSEYSRKLSVSKYRGYQGPTGANQLYNLLRDQLVATFRIKNSAGLVVASQSFNAYAGTVVTVDDMDKFFWTSTQVGDPIVLSSFNDGKLGNIGLRISFISSMLATTDADEFAIYSQGDNISITVANPNYTDFVPINTSSTMKTFTQFTFNGTAYIDSDMNQTRTNRPLSINISRLKIKNSSYTTSYFYYSIFNAGGNTTLWKSNYYLGNPEYVTEWTQIFRVTSESLAGQQNKTTIGHISLWRPANTTFSSSICYLVVAPPHLVFTQMTAGTGQTAINTLPFNASFTSGNIKYSYLPVHDTNLVYNPYTTRTIRYANNASSFDIVYDNTTNNVAITLSSLKLPYTYKTSPLNTVNGFKIYGNHYTVKLYLGLSSSTNPILLTQLYTGRADDMLTNPQGLSLTSYTSSNGNAKFSFLQPLLGATIGRTVNLTEAYGNTSSAIYSAIYADEGALPNSIVFQLNSFFLSFGDSRLTSAKLDIPLLEGITVNLYTRNVVVQSDGTVKVHVYKYTPITSTPLNQSNQVNTIYFTSREYKILSVPSISVATRSIPNWSDLISSITTVPTSWTQDTSYTFTTFVSLVNYNTEAKDDIYTVIFGCENTGALKATYITKAPILTIINKVGMPIFQITAEGVVKTPLLCTTGISLMPLTVNTPINNSLQNLTLATTDSYSNSASSPLVNV